MRNIVHSLQIEKVKGLKNTTIEFREKGLTAIMGVNGSGKSTVLHALACAYNPIDLDIPMTRFPQFFKVDNFEKWEGTRFVMEYSNDTLENYKRAYYKNKKWARYDRRPARNVIYMGIDTCVPEVEKERWDNIAFSAEENEENKIAQECAKILDKPYEQYTVQTGLKKVYSAVKQTSGLQYSSLSMGSGEQRVFQIVKNVMNAMPSSLILIDEIDLLLHIKSLKKLIEFLSEVAKKRNLQIVFSTHSMVMNELKNHLDIKYIHNTLEKTLVYDGIPTEFLTEMTGEMTFPVKVQVEDVVSEKIIRKICMANQWTKYIQIFQFGSWNNSLMLVAGKILERQLLESTIFVMDGDVEEINDNEKRTQKLKGKFSGTIDDLDTKVENALQSFVEYKIEKGKNPEKQLFDMIVSDDFDSENISNDEKIIYDELIKTSEHNISDKHEWLELPIENSGIPYDDALSKILDMAARTEAWNAMTEAVKQKIEETLKQFRVIKEQQ